MQDVKAGKKSRTRAAIIATAVGCLLMVPVAYLARLELRDMVGEMKSYGSVPDFALISRDGNTVVTHYDTYRRVTVVANFLRSCHGESCARLLREVESLKKWSDTALISKQANDSKPQDILFIAISAQPLDTAIAQFAVAQTQPYLLPAGYTLDAQESMVIAAISQDSEYAGVLAGRDEMLIEKLQKLLSSLTSEAYLFHYLTMQSLMWQRAKDYARGKLTTGEESQQ